MKNSKLKSKPIKEVLKQLTFDKLTVGMTVKDVDRHIGVVKSCDDIHNIQVEYVKILSVFIV